MLTLTFPFAELIHFMLIVQMVRITWIQEVELRVTQFVLPNTRFEFRPISSNETGSFIDDIYFTLGRWVSKCLCVAFKKKSILLLNV